MTDSDVSVIFQERRNRLKRILAQERLDALIVTDAVNRFYLSGFELHDTQCNESSGFLLITANDEDFLFTDSRYDIAARAVWNGVVCIYKNDATAILANCLNKKAVVAGFEKNSVSWGFIRALKLATGDYNPVLLPTTGLVEKLRIIKEPCEIKALEKSFNVNHQTVALIDNLVADHKIENLTEKQLAWKIEKFFRENGADELAFATIVASGAHAALPHAGPRNVTIGGDVSLLVDLGCRVDNYCSDQTRVWWLGKSGSEFFDRTWKLVRDAQEAALEMMKSGVSGADVYRAALAVFEKSGQEKYFTHGLGHGVGLQTHEPPSLSSRSNTILRSGMVVTVEPGLYYPDWGGIRWENTVVIEEDGVRIL